MGMHEVLVTNEGEAVRGAPHFLRSMPKSKKDYDGMYKIDNSHLMINDLTKILKISTSPIVPCILHNYFYEF